MMKLTVKDIAEARGFKNAKQLADAAGLRYKSMYPIWNGTARMIGLDTLEKLCDTLRVQAGMLFEKVQDDEPLPQAGEQAATPRRSSGSSVKSRRESKQARAAVTIG